MVRSKDRGKKPTRVQKQMFHARVSTSIINKIRDIASRSGATQEALAEKAFQLLFAEVEKEGKVILDLR